MDLSTAYHPSAISRRAARAGLIVLTLVNLFNYLDRWVVSSVVESIKRSEIGLSDLQAGLLTSGFIIVYMVASPFFGTLGGKTSRTRLIAAGVALWSVATAAGGLAHGFYSLFAARAAVGVGEASYGTVSPTLLADYFPRELRGRVFSIFFAAIPVGAALGYVVGGFVDQRYGWRAAFYIAGAPGVLLAALILFIPDPGRGSPQPAKDVTLVSGFPSFRSRRGAWSTYLDLLRNGTYLWTVIGYAAYTFAIGGLAFWMPSFLERVRGLSKPEATVQFGSVVVVTGLVGTFTGGWLGDYLLKYLNKAYLWLSGVATLFAAPFALAALCVSNQKIYLGSLVIAELLMFVSTGPVNTVIINCVAPHQRTEAMALSIFGIHLLGDAPSPTLIGAISDASSLQTAVLIVPMAILLSGIVWTWLAATSRRLEV